MEPTLQNIQKAADRIRQLIHQTPVLTNETINRMAEARLFFKCENFQKAGAFKMRGAANAVLSLPEAQRQQGVATHSSGNHGQALAKAAQSVGIKAYIVMPENAPEVKKRAVAAYGAEIIFCRPTLEARETTLAQVVDDTGAAFIHPYNHDAVIAGQGTAALELLQEVKGLQAVIAPVGGGGLLSGTAIAVRGISAEIQVFAGEPEGADDTYRSMQEGKIIPSSSPNTIADGLLTSLGTKTFPVIQKYVAGILTVADPDIVGAMQLIWERMKIVVEPSSAVPLAAVLKNKALFKGKKVGVILSGGNVDVGKLPF